MSGLPITPILQPVPKGSKGILNESSRKEFDVIIQELRTKNVGCLVISGIFSPVKPEQERVVAQYFKAAIPNLDITISSAVGGLGELLLRVLYPCLSRVVFRARVYRRHVGTGKRSYFERNSP